MSGTRRTTLASVGPSAANSRASLAGPARRGSAIPRPSMGGKGGQRQSVGPSKGGGGRASKGGQPLGRSSTAGSSRAASMSLGGSRQSYAPSSSGAIHRVQDPRNLSDKATFAKSIRDLISFLVERGYSEPISPKSLVAPSVRDFKNILQFMVQMHDPCWQIADKNFEDDVVAVFARLRYPVAISKRSLSSVGAQHTWPVLLGALTWLMNLLLYMEDIEARENQYMAQNPEGLFFLWLSEAYSRWMHEEDTDVLEGELSQIFDGQIQAVSDQLAHIAAENAQMQTQLEEFRNNPSLVNQVKGQLNTLKSDLQKFQQLIAQLRDYRQKLSDKLVELDHEKEKQNMEIHELAEKRKELDAKLEKQELTPADVERMNRDLRRLEEQLSSTRRQKDDLSTQVWNLESECSSLMSELDRKVFEYNSMATKLKLLPITAKHAGGRDFELRINREASRFDELVTLDLKGTLKPKLRTVTELSGDKCRAKQQELIEVEGTLAHKRDELGDQEEELSQLDHELHRLEEQYRSKKEQLTSNLARFKQETADLEDQVEQLKNGPSLSPEESERKMEELREEFASLQQEFEEENTTLTETMYGALQELTDHKEYITSTLKELEAHHQTFLESLQQ